MKQKNMYALIVVLVLVVGFLAGGLLMGVGDGFTFAVTEPTTQVVEGEEVIVQEVQCESSTTPTVTLNVYDSTPDNTGTILNSDYNVTLFAVENGALSLIGETTAGTGIEVPVNTTVAAFLEDKDGTHDVYGSRKDFFVGCQENIIKNEAIGVQDAALSTAVYNVTGGDTTANTAAAPTTIAAGGTASFKVNVSTSTANARWGTLQEGATALIVLDYDEDDMKKPESGSGLVEVPVPQGHKDTDVTASSDQSVAYVMDATLLSDSFTQGIDLYFTAEAASGATNPDTDSNIGITIYDKEMYQNDAGVFVVGYRDMDASYGDLGETNQTDIFHVE